MENKNRLYVIYGENAREMAYTLMQTAGPAKGLDRNAKIVLKPNLVVARPHTTGATTNPKTCEGVIVYLKENGFHNIRILESAWTGADTKRAFRACGYADLSKKYAVPLLDVKRDEYIEKSVEGIRFLVSKSASEADFIINLPVIKGHCQTRLTCALKNMKGLIPDSEKKRYHREGLHRPIACLNRAIRQDFVVADGMLGDLDFELGGNPVRMNVMLAGADPVLVDAYAASLLGYGADEIAYIDIAHRMQIGCKDLAEADIVTLSKANEKRVFSPSSKVKELMRYVEEKDACSACVGSLIRALYRLEDRQKLSDMKICVGQGFKGQKGKLGVGSCTGGFEKCVTGCPPNTMDILKFLKEL